MVRVPVDIGFVTLRPVDQTPKITEIGNGGSMNKPGFLQAGSMVVPLAAGFVLDLGTDLLLDANGTTVDLRPQAWAVLRHLALNPGRVVTKEELFEAVWPGLVVTDDSLTQAVCNVRAALGAAGHQVIKTVPKRGYALIGGSAARSEAVAHTPTPFDQVPTNLAKELPPLYGRENDLDALEATIEAHKLVTIVGAGGLGKSRMAEAAASLIRQRYPDGVWLVELAPLTDGASLPGAVAGALGVALSGRRPPLGELMTTLEAQRLLLVLDNCEYLIDAVAGFSEALLKQAPLTHILATSQLPLGLSDEHLFRLGPLALPETLDVGQAIEYGAVRLFCERVSALDRHFALNARNVAWTVGICRQLDGLPLALELAAARVPLLGVEGVHERLAQRLDILTSAPRDHQKRHQTLRSVLDWSHGLLDVEEQAVFRRLGVFSGGCTVKAAQHVASGDGLSQSRVLEVLGKLVDRSLVVPESSEQSRLRLLESMRLYAIEKLAQAGETATLRLLHAKYFSTYFRAVAGLLYGGTWTEDRFLSARKTELDNLREAIDNSLDSNGDPCTGLELLVAAAPMSLLLPLSAQSPRWWHTLAQSMNPVTPEGAAKLRYCWIHWGQGVWWRSDTWPERPESVAVELEALHEPRMQAHALCLDAFRAGSRRDFVPAYAALDVAASLEKPDWPAWLRSRLSFFRAMFDRETGKQGATTTAINAALADLDAAGEGGGRWAFIVRSNLALEPLLRGEAGEAANRLQVLAEQGNLQGQGSEGLGQVLSYLVLALVQQGELGAASGAAINAAQHLKRSAQWPIFGSSLALLAAKLGNLKGAALMIGAIDARMTRHGTQ
ncbi:ATP-binding protein, partial [Variovorax sp. GT1P44]|uniref:ATP-binding protein n=1 Tax=Variovorax sp. GT1P44 TaxID=3443742 RepID=UPI003F46DC33